jgi:putative ABC transport system permease protein
MTDVSRRLTLPLGELLRVSGSALARQKLGTALSVLGVVIGVAAVVAMWSVSEGARRQALTEVGRLGLGNILIRSQQLPPDSGQPAANGLTIADGERLARLVPQSESVALVIQRFLPISGPAASRPAAVTGVTADYQSIVPLALRAGRLLGPFDDRTARCLVGWRLAEALFGGADPIGRSLQVDRRWLAVVGVIADRVPRPQPVSDAGVPDLEESLVVPLSTMLRRQADLDPGQTIDQIWLRIRDGRRVIEIGEIARQTLLRLHDGRADFTVLVPRALLDQRLRTQRTFSIVIGSIAALSLLVSGIGIMNIMLASVVARTHEIGIRRTAGATRRWIVSQFLTESVMMTFGGGLAGLLLGIGVSRGVTAFAGWPTLVSLPGVVLGLTVSVLVGLVFGIYPALRAARLDPIDAVRYE